MLCLVVLTYDRYLLITKPLRYYTIMTKTRFIILSVVLWIYSSVLALSPMFWHNRQEILGRLEPVKLCIFSFFHAMSIEEMRYLGMPTAALCFACIFGMNFKIYSLASKASKKIHVHGISEISNSQRSGPNSVQSRNIEVNVNECLSDFNGTMTNNMLYFQAKQGRNSGTEKLGNSENTPVKRNFKQAKTILIMVGCFTLCVMPYSMLCALQTYGLYFSVTIARIEELAMYCLISNSMINPIIYSYRMKNFRNGIKKLVKF